MERASDKQSQVIARLVKDLDKDATAKTKQWFENYLKHVIPYRGVTMGNVRKRLHSFYERENLNTWSADEQLSLALKLFENEHAEDKFAGMLMMDEILIPNSMIDWQTDLHKFERLFDDGLIFDWSTCDWFCIKVLGSLVKLHGEPCAQAIVEWKHAKNDWRKRASLVTFAMLAKKGDDNFAGFCDMIFETSQTLIVSPFRFHQTACGWLLRELSHKQKAKVKTFCKKNAKHMSKEALKYSSEKFSSAEKKQIQALFVPPKNSKTKTNNPKIKKKR